MHNKIIARIAVAGVFAVTVVSISGLFGSNLQSSCASAADNPSSYKALFQEKCSACHNLPDPAVTQYTRAQWRSTVDRMLNKHQASDSISPQESDQIVEYLGLFPPKVMPGSNSPLAIKASDVWTTEPTKSLVFTLSSAGQLESFKPQRGSWGLVPDSADAAGRSYLLQSQPLSGDDAAAVFMESKDRIAGDVDVQTQFRFAPKSARQSIGLLLSAADARNYYVVRFDGAKSEVDIIEDKDGQFAVVGTAPTGDMAPSPDGWHNLRAMYHADSQSLTVWVDADKKAVVKLPDWSDNASFGLVTQGATTAGFRNLTVDMYAPTTGA